MQMRLSAQASSFSNRSNIEDDMEGDRVTFMPADDKVTVVDDHLPLEPAPTPEPQKKPTFHDWLTACFCSLCMLLSMGAALNLNLFVDDIRASFRIDYSDASWVVGTALAIVQGFGPFAAVILETVGYRNSVIAAGLIAGISQTLVYFIHNYGVLMIVLGVVYGAANAVIMVAAVSVPSSIFSDRYRHIALSITFIGIALAQSILPLMNNAIREVYGSWRVGMVVGGALTLNIIPAGIIMPQMRGKATSLKDKFKLSLWKNWKFVAIFCGTLILQFVGVGTGAFFLSLLKSDYGLSQTDASIVLTIFGVVMIAGRLSVTLVKQRENFPRWCVFCLYCALHGANVVVLGFCKGFAAAVVNFIGLGFWIGAIYPVHAIMICDIIPGDQLTSAFGYTNLALGIGSLAGPPLVGSLRDHMDTFKYACLLMGLISTISFILALVTFAVRRVAPRRR